MNSRLGLYLLLTICLLGCERKYTIEGDKVYFNYWNEGSGSNKWLLDSADGKTFKTLNIKCDGDFVFGKDKKHLFIDGVPIRGIDPNTFTFVGNYVFRDKDSAYFFGAYSDIQNCCIHNVDPNKIRIIQYPWAKVDNVLIYGYKTIQLDDVADFVPINENWGKTKKVVIYRARVLKDADPETFTVINNYSGKDKRHTYEFGEIKE